MNDRKSEAIVTRKPYPSNRKQKPLQQRFEDSFERVPESGCWIWMRRIDKDGYGFMNIQNRNVRAHRYSWSSRNGEIPAGLIIRHTCDIASCVNPDHLLIGTQKDNEGDKHSRNRQNPPFGNEHPNAVLTVSVVIAARKLYAEGERVASIARKFGVNFNTMNSAIKRKLWRHVP